MIRGLRPSLVKNIISAGTSIFNESIFGINNIGPITTKFSTNTKETYFNVFTAI